MKIIQSLWTKPLYKKKDLHINDRAVGGWLAMKYHFLSWIYSSLQFKQFYPQVELVTDKRGYYQLIELLKLPYDKVTVTLNQLDDYPEDLWAMGKLLTYSLQDEPFIHADDDVYIFDKFPKHIEQAGLLAQNLESGFSYYETILREIKASFSYIPDYTMTAINNQNWTSLNAGIFGGNNISFFKTYTSDAFRFIEENKPSYDKMEKSMFALLNIIYEQYLFLSLAESKEEKVECLIEHVTDKYLGLGDFDDTPIERQYLHLVGIFKQMPSICEKLEKRVMVFYPKYYERFLEVEKQLVNG